MTTLPTQTGPGIRTWADGDALAGDGIARAAEAPRRVDRFVIVRRLGSGAMGVVYAAYDERLDRSVALKFVRHERRDARTRARILREAQALARLSHPNVVQVYEVVEFADQIVLVMEHIRGETLRSWVKKRWETSKSPAVGAVLKHYLAAGEGLAAAHAAGLVHRDFKPDNVLVGDDGRVRVIDFGLATSGRGIPMGDGAPESTWSDAEISLTATNAVLGTPPYTAPEQLAGGVSDARSDVFSFTVGLYEAVFGVRPHGGESPAELLRNIQARARAPATRKGIEPWLVAVLDRGLEPDPDRRWPSMDALLSALRDDPTQRRRRRWGVMSVALTALALFGAVMARAHLGAARCAAEGARSGALWGPEAASRVEAAFLESGSPHAEPTWQRVQAHLDSWSGEWTRARVEACAESLPDEDLKVECLEQALWRAEGLVRALAGVDAATVSHAASAVYQLPPVDRCDDPRWLRAYGSGARSLALTAPTRIIVEREIAQLWGLLDLGKHGEVLARITPLASVTERLAEEDLAAEVRLLEGKAARKSGDLETAEAATADAYYRAGAVGDARLAADAAITEVAILGVDLGREEALAPWLANATMMLKRGDLSDTPLDGTWRLIRGVLHRMRGEYDAALKSYDEALAIRSRTFGAVHPESAKVYMNMGNIYAVRSEHALAVEHLRRGLRIFIEGYGAQHPDVSVFRSNLAVVLDQMGEHELSLEQYRMALAADEVNFGPDHPAVASTVFNIGTLLAEQGDLERVDQYFERAAKIFTDKLGPDHPQLGYVFTQYGHVCGRRGEVERGVRLIERAETIRRGGDPGQLALTRFRLASLLWVRDREGDRSRALRLATYAREIFAAEAQGDPALLAEVEAWLAERRGVSEAAVGEGST